MTSGKPIAVKLQSISGVSAINPFNRLLRHPWKKGRGAVLFFTTSLLHGKNILYRPLSVG
jgi:hypothetical protein